MAGTKTGGKLAAKTNKKKYGDDHYHRIGKLGGAAGHEGKGFAANRELAKRVGVIGGRKSRRTKNAIS